jgi:hypothetical protein
LYHPRIVFFGGFGMIFLTTFNPLLIMRTAASPTRVLIHDRCLRHSTVIPASCAVKFSEIRKDVSSKMVRSWARYDGREGDCQICGRTVTEGLLIFLGYCQIFTRLSESSCCIACLEEDKKSKLRGTLLGMVRRCTFLNCVVE